MHNLFLYMCCKCDALWVYFCIACHESCVLLCVQCGSEAAGVFGASFTEEDQDPGPGWSHGCCRSGDGRSHPVHHPHTVRGLHRFHHRSQTQHHHGLHQVPESTHRPRHIFLPTFELQIPKILSALLEPFIAFCIWWSFVGWSGLVFSLNQQILS